MRHSYNSTIENYDSLFIITCLVSTDAFTYVHTYIHNISYSSKLVITPGKKEIKVVIKENNGRAKPTPALSEGASFGGTVSK